MTVQELIHHLQKFDGEATVNVHIEGSRSQVEIEDVRQGPTTERLFSSSAANWETPSTKAAAKVGCRQWPDDGRERVTSLPV